MSHILIVYYSRKGENYWGGNIKNLSKGNTEIVAEMIKDAVGGDLFEVDTVKAYSTDYHACTEEAQKELRENARPELKNTWIRWMIMIPFLQDTLTGGERCLWQCSRFLSDMT